MTYTKEQQAANRQKWVAALRSGEFKQTRGRLYDDKTDGYCCLGVACELAVRDHVIPPRTQPTAPGPEDDETTIKRWVYGGQAGFLPGPVKHWLGVDHDFVYLRRRIFPEAGGMSANSLVELNDYLNYSFVQIADEIDNDNIVLEGESA